MTSKVRKWKWNHRGFATSASSQDTSSFTSTSTLSKQILWFLLRLPISYWTKTLERLGIKRGSTMARHAWSTITLQWTELISTLRKEEVSRGLSTGLSKMVCRLLDSWLWLELLKVICRSTETLNLHGLQSFQMCLFLSTDATFRVSRDWSLAYQTMAIYR